MYKKSLIQTYDTFKVRNLTHHDGENLNAADDGKQLTHSGHFFSKQISYCLFDGCGGGKYLFGFWFCLFIY